MYNNRKCMKCGKTATHKFTRIEKGQVYDVFLCEEHAAEESPYQKKTPLSDILEDLLKKDVKAKSSGGPPPPPSLRCQCCGLPFEAYRKNLLLGCSECYAAFHDYLIADLRRFHGETHHLGRRPGSSAAPSPAPDQEPILPDFSAEAAEAAPKEQAPPEALSGEALAHPESLPLEADFEPLSQEDPEDQLEMLTRTMKRAIAEENYTLAAHCRDQIRELKARLEHPSGE